MSNLNQSLSDLLKHDRDDFASRWKDAFGPPRQPDTYMPLGLSPSGISDIRITGRPTYHMAGIEVIQDPHLTVDGEPDSAAYPDWRERYLRNEARWRAGVYRIHQRPVRMEPLWYTPQVPNPDIIKMEVDGRTVFVAHPVTWQRAMQKMTEVVGEKLYDEKFRTMMYGQGWGASHMP